MANEFTKLVVQAIPLDNLSGTTMLVVEIQRGEVMTRTDLDRPAHAREAHVLAQQIDCFVAKLNVTNSSDERFQVGTTEFRLAADAYERIASAAKRANPVVCERTAVDGRNGDELMERLWQVRQALRRLGKADF